MMPVHKLPDASWQVALGLGFVSAVFDNIPLTALALKQGGYDWGFVAYAVGFGGSMIWFGSSAGVALTNQFPEGKSVFAWLRGRLARRARVRHRICRDARCSPHGCPTHRTQGVAGRPRHRWCAPRRSSADRRLVLIADSRNAVARRLASVIWCARRRASIPGADA